MPTTATMSQVTLHRRGHFFYVLVLNGQAVHPFFLVPFATGNATIAGHGKRKSAPATISACHVFPTPKPSCPAFANRSNGRQDRFQANAAGGTPETASHARMTMAVRDFRHGGRKAGLSLFCPLHRLFPLFPCRNVLP